MRALLGLAAILGAACYPQPTIGDCTVQCGAAEACPAGTSCGADGYCHAPASETAMCTGLPDAAADADPSQPDADPSQPDADPSQPDAGPGSATVVGAFGFGGAGDDRATQIAANDTLIAVTGSLTGAIDIASPGPVGTRDGFALQLSPALAVQHLHRIGGAGVEADGLAVAIDGAQVVATGAANGTLAFNPPKPCEYFVAGYGTDAAESWFDCVETDSSGGGVADDPLGGLATTGLFSGTAAFGETAHTASGIFDIFIASYDAGPTLARADTYGGSASDRARGLGIAIDSAGNRYITGFFSGQLATGGASPLLAVNNSVFVSSYQRSGAYRWAVAFANAAGTTTGHALALGTGGALVVTGTMAGNIDFGDASRTGNAYVASVRTDNGATNWSAVGLGPSLVPTAVATDAGGNIYVVGSFGTNMDFGGQSRTGMGGNDIFVMKLTSAGALSWLETWGTSADEGATGVAVTPSGRVFVSGFYGGNIDFGAGHTLTHQGGTDGFVIELAP